MILSWLYFASSLKIIVFCVPGGIKCVEYLFFDKWAQIFGKSGYFIFACAGYIKE